MIYIIILFYITIIVILIISIVITSKNDKITIDIEFTFKKLLPHFKITIKK